MRDPTPTIASEWERCLAAGIPNCAKDEKQRRVLEFVFYYACFSTMGLVCEVTTETTDPAVQSEVFGRLYDEAKLHLDGLTSTFRRHQL